MSPFCWRTSTGELALGALVGGAEAGVVLGHDVLGDVGDAGRGADVVEAEARAVGTLHVEGVEVVVAEGVVLATDLGPRGGSGKARWRSRMRPSTCSLTVVFSSEMWRRVLPLVTRSNVAVLPRLRARRSASLQNAEHLVIELLRVDFDDEGARGRQPLRGLLPVRPAAPSPG